MRGVWRIRKFLRGSETLRRWRLVLGAMRLLKNWREMLAGLRRETAGGKIGRPVMVFRNGLEIAMVNGGYGVFKYVFSDLFVDNCYEPTVLLRPRDGWTVVDVGAHVGCYSCKTAFEHRGARIVAVEPMPAYADTLRSNIARNRLENVEVVNAAVCAAPGSRIRIPVWYAPGGEVMVHEETSDAEIAEWFEVGGLTLEELFESKRVQRCDLLKMDIEGGEYDIFRHMPTHIWNRIDRIVMEVHASNDWKEADITDAMRQHGFVVGSDGKTGTHLLWAYRSAEITEE